MSQDYEKNKYLNGLYAMQRAMAQLREHFTNVDITCSYLDKNGVSITHNQEWVEDDDDEDNGVTSPISHTQG